MRIVSVLMVVSCPTASEIGRERETDRKKGRQRERERKSNKEREGEKDI